MDTIINAIGSIYNEAEIIKTIIFTFLSIWLFHSWFYRILGFFATRKFKKAKTDHKYAIVIAARNEENVIGNLLKSIQRQDYPSELLTVFVVADNCTDSTAEVARNHGAVCYERFDTEHRTKGYALQFLFNNIKRDYGIESFEGYFVFDADNLLKVDYITRMNEAFDEGEKIVTSYRNTKNFDENWIASTYAIHWLRSIRSKHRARSVLRLATNIQGTGFLFANELIRNGWNYTSITEDRAFTADAVAHGYPISYCDAAEFYDEQPTSMRIALRQRLRWSKGHLLAFAETGPKLFKNIFVGNCYRDKSVKRPMNKERVIEGIRSRWASFDTLSQLMPLSVFYAAVWLTVSCLIYSCYCYGAGFTNLPLSGPESENPLQYLLIFFTGDVVINLAPGYAAMLCALGTTLLCNIISKISSHIGNMIMATYVFIVERKRIIKIPLYKKIFYVFTWPVFDIIGRWTTYFALFQKVEWKPIPHTSKVTIDDIEEKTENISQK